MNDSVWFGEFWLWLEYLEISFQIGATWWFPFIESLHVIAITFLVGSILMIDLRLLGLAARVYPVSRLSSELLPWTWAAFCLATITGLAMFITRAWSHVQNPAFQIKMVLLLLAGFNMAWFHLQLSKTSQSWDTAARTPKAVRATGAASLLLWAGVMLAGRWVGHIV